MSANDEERIRSNNEMILYSKLNTTYVDQDEPFEGNANNHSSPYRHVIMIDQR